MPMVDENNEEEKKEKNDKDKEEGRDEEEEDSMLNEKPDELDSFDDIIQPGPQEDYDQLDDIELDSTANVDTEKWFVHNTTH
jgi:hypothetical protein